MHAGVASLLEHGPRGFRDKGIFRGRYQSSIGLILVCLKLHEINTVVPIACKRKSMKDESILIRHEHVSDRSFDAVVAAFEAAVGTADEDSFRAAVNASANTEDFERRVRAFEGPSGFMRFMQIDHGAWMAKIGLTARVKLYILGNPLIARTTLERDIGAGLNVPVRALIYEDPRSGTCRLAYDLPSSQLARLGNERLIEAARRLDEKLKALAESVTGSTA